MATEGTSREIDVEDRLAITELLSKYGLLLDTGRSEAWLELFTVDASLEISGRPKLTTAEDLRKLATGAPRGVHLAAPPIIASDSSRGAARVEQSFLFRNSGTGEIRAGWYEDSVVCTAGRWLFRRRVIRFFEPT